MSRIKGQASVKTDYHRFSMDEWEERAACKGSDTELFFDTKYTKFVINTFCDVCPVKRECLEKALRSASPGARERQFGVQGGMTAHARRRLARVSEHADKRPRMSDYIGVSLRDLKGTLVWTATCPMDDDEVVVGTWAFTPTGEKQAAKGYDRAARRWLAPGSPLNFPPGASAPRTPELGTGQLSRKLKTSQYRGVTRAPATGKWRAYIRVGKETRYLGTFDATSEGEMMAARTYDREAWSVHGLRAKLNFTREEAAGY